MSIVKEIESNSSEEDKPALRWLLEQYPRSSTWSFIATCSHQTLGDGAWMRIWKPTKEGRILYLNSLVDYPTRHKWAYPDGTPKGEERLSQADEILVLRRELLDAVKERDAARRDADRYRWLKSGGCYWVEIQSQPSGDYIFRGQAARSIGGSIDNAIDAVLAAQQEGGGA